MQLFIPTIGTKLKLEAEWSFTIIAAGRNDSLLRAAGLGAIANHGVMYKDKTVGKVTLPKDTVLTVDRIYIRQGKKDYDSITFVVRDSPQFGNKRARFFVRLSEVNGMEYSLVA
jgi:hypothetical protein